MLLNDRVQVKLGFIVLDAGNSLDHMDNIPKSLDAFLQFDILSTLLLILIVIMRTSRRVSYLPSH